MPMNVIKNIFFLGYAPPTGLIEWVLLIAIWVSALLFVLAVLMIIVLSIIPESENKRWESKERLKQLLFKHSNQGHDNLIEVLLTNQDKEISRICNEMTRAGNLDTAIRQILNEVYEENNRSNDDTTAINTTLQIVNTNTSNATQF